MAGSEWHILSTAQLLGRTWRVFRRHFLCFLGIMAPPALAFLVSIPLMFLLIASEPGSDLREAYKQASPLRKAGIVPLAFAWNVVMVRACSASIFAASEFYLGRSVKVRQAFGRVRRKPLRLFWMQFILGILSAGPLAFVTIPIAIAYLPAIPIAVLENLGVREALNRSSLLTKGGYARVILLFLLDTVLVVTAVFGLFGFLSVTQPLVDSLWVRSVIGVVGLWFVMLVPQ